MHSQSTQLSLTCPICGTEFLRKRSQVAKHLVSYCSKACYHAAYQGRVSLVCPGCGVTFSRFQAELRKVKHGVTFCNRECRKATANVSYVCAACGKTATCYKTHRRKFCSPECAASEITISENQALATLIDRTTTPDGCHTWTGRKTPRGYGILGGFTYAHRLVIERRIGRKLTSDEFICHDCPDGDNTSCVRDEPPGTYEIDGRSFPKHGHLWIGDADANRADSVLKHQIPSGDRHWRRRDQAAVALP